MNKTSTSLSCARARTSGTEVVANTHCHNANELLRGNSDSGQGATSKRGFLALLLRAVCPEKRGTTISLEAGVCSISFAQDNLFSAAAAVAVEWTQKVLSANLTYFRLRRELHDEFCRLLNPVDGAIKVRISQESFIVIRYFLTARNDTLNDDKRLSFDKAILQLRNDAFAALAAAPPPQPQGLVARLMGPAI